MNEKLSQIFFVKDKYQCFLFADSAYRMFELNCIWNGKHSPCVHDWAAGMMPYGFLFVSFLAAPNNSQNFV